MLAVCKMTSPPRSRRKKFTKQPRSAQVRVVQRPDDGIWVVRRLVNNGAISDSQGRQVTFYLGQGYRLEELLLDQVPDQLFLDLLVARFRPNILDFSFLSAPCRTE